MATSTANVNLSDDKTTDIYASIAVLWIASMTAVAGRFISRRLSHQKLWWDDWLIVISCLSLTAIAAGNFIAAYLGAGRHIEFVITAHPQNIQYFLEYVYAVELLYPFGVAPTKCSILCLYIRLFGVHRKFKIYCMCLIFITVTWAIALEFGAIFQCSHVSDSWNPESDRSDCVHLEAFLVGTNVPNIILDLSILVAPIYPIWKLKLPTGKKIAIALILMLGAGETAFSIVRLVILTSLETSDVTWNYVPALVWSFVEISIGIICVCLPLLGPLLPKGLLQRLGSRKSGRAYQPQRGSNYALKNVDSRRKFDRLDHDSFKTLTGPEDAYVDITENPDSIQRTTELSVESHPTKFIKG